MKITLYLLSFLNGGFMLLDGIYVMLKGKYIGPEKPGPWAYLFSKMNIDVFKLGPLFVIYGLLWITFIYSMLSSQAWAYSLGIAVSILTLWYLPAGTLVSVAVLILLTGFRNKTGI